jgi:hypothetical protein
MYVCVCVYIQLRSVASIWNLHWFDKCLMKLDSVNEFVTINLYLQHNRLGVYNLNTFYSEGNDNWCTSRHIYYFIMIFI